MLQTRTINVVVGGIGQLHIFFLTHLEIKGFAANQTFEWLPFSKIHRMIYVLLLVEPFTSHVRTHAHRVLGLDDSSPAIENWANLDQAARADRAAYVGLGGGHYAPRYSDLARLDGRYIGHMLASYCLDFGEEGRWQEAVTEAVQSTRAAFPGAGGGVTGGVAALVDKKSFRSADRSALLEHLTALGVEHKFKNSDC